MGYRVEITVGSEHWQKVSERSTRAAAESVKAELSAANPDEQYRVVYCSDEEYAQMERTELSAFADGTRTLLFTQEPELWELWDRLMDRGLLAFATDADGDDRVSEHYVVCEITDAGREALVTLTPATR